MSPFRFLQFPAHTGSSWRPKAFSILYMIFQDSLTWRSICSASSSMKLPSIHSLCHFFHRAAVDQNWKKGLKLAEIFFSSL